MEHGADPNKSDKHNVAPLWMTCLHGYEACARLLLDHGADVNAKYGFEEDVLQNGCSLEVIVGYIGGGGRRR